MRSLCVKLVPCSLVILVCLVRPFGMALTGEPVENNEPATSNANADSSRTIYDQRQTGKYNIHVSIKDVALIEVDQNGIEDVGYDDSDYYYDEGHLTVKPLLLNPNTTQRQPNVSSTTTIPTTLSLTQQTSTHSSSPIPQTISDNPNLSPNLLADIAATHAISNDSNNSLTFLNSPKNSTPANVPKKGTQNVVILDAQALTHNSPTSTHKPSMSSTIQQPVETNARSKDVSIQSILQGGLLPTNSHKLPLRPYLRFDDHSSLDETSANNQQPKEQENDSRIYKFKIRRAQKQASPGMKTQAASVGYPVPHFQSVTARRCRRHQYRDASGECRSKRSSSILKKLFSMLVSLPFSNERAIGDRDDE